MQKGILLEVEGRTGIVLTPEGEFRRVPLPAGDPAVGDEILVPEAGAEPWRWTWGWVAAAAAVLLMVLSPVGYWQWSLGQPAALVMIDINPSVELTVNGRRHVVEAQGLNPDGQEVLEQVEWRRQPVEDVARAIAAQAIQLGKLNPAADDSAVVVAVAPLGGRTLPGSLSQTIVEQSRTALREVVAEEAESQGAAPQAGVAVLEATADEVEEARRQDLTVPKLLILEEVQADHPEVTADAIRAVPPGQFLKSLGIHPSEVFSRAEQRRTQAGPGNRANADDDDDDDDRGRPGRGNQNNPGNGNPGKGNPGKDSPGKDNPGKDKPGKDKPGKDNPGKDNPGKDKPGKDSPGKDNPGRDNPGKVNPGPGKDNPGKDKPVKDNPGKSKPGRGGDDDDDRPRPGQGNQSNPGKGNPGKGNQGSPGQGNQGRPGQANPGNPGSGANRGR